MIENKNEFCKIFGYNIPYFSEFDYYVNQLSKSPEYKDIFENIILFENFEKFINDNDNYISIKNYKLDFALPFLISKIKDNETYQKFLNFNPIFTPLHDSFDNFKTELQENELTLSIDLKEGNYSIFSNYLGQTSLPSTFSEFIDQNNEIHSICKFKTFRQLLFGHINPKKINNIQQMIIREIAEKLAECGYKYYNISSDELRYGGDIDTLKKIKELVDKMTKIPPIHYKLFYSYNIDDIIVHEYFNVKSLLDFNVYSKDYEKLVGVPGNLFHYYFKQHILKEKLDERDLYFYSEKRLAKWIL